MERTKYTPKRLLSLLLALIMLLGMLPTAVFAAEPEEGPVVTPYTYNKNGLVFTFTVDIPDGPYYESSYATHVYYTITKADDNVEVSALTSLLRHDTGVPDFPVASNISASEERFAQSRHLGSNDHTYVFDAGTVLASGEFTYTSSALTGTNLTNRELDFPFRFSAAWEGISIDDHYATQYGSEATNSIVTGSVKVTNLPLNCSVTYKDGGYTGVDGIPVGTFYATGKDYATQTYTIPAGTPTLAGYTFKGWSSDTWVKLADDGTTALTGKDALFQPEEVVQYKVIDGKNTVLTAVWEPTEAANTHTVRFVRNNATDGSATNWPNDLTGAEGEKVKIPWTTPTAEGKTFLGWSTTENATAAETDYARGKEVTLGDKDIILYAVWKADTVTIIYPTNNRPWDESHSPEGTDEYDGVWISETGKKTNVTRGSKQTFTVRLDDGYDPQYLLVIKNTKNAADTSFVGRGLNYVGSYTPQHWVEGQQKYTEYYYEYYADEDEIHIHIDLPQKIKYTVTLPVSDKVDVAFKDETIAGNKSTTVKHGENVTFKVTARPGYTVKGVYVNGEKKGNAAGEYTISNITANQTVTVDVAAIVLRNVTYVLDGAQMATQQVEDGTAFTPLNAPTKTGYTFDGWYRSAEYKEVLPDSLSVTKDTIFYGRYVAKTYEISFDSNLPADYTGTAMPLVPTPVKKTYGQAVQLPTWTPSLPDGSYQFKGWSTIPVGEAAYAPARPSPLRSQAT